MTILKLKYQFALEGSQDPLDLLQFDPVAPAFATFAICNSLSPLPFHKRSTFIGSNKQTSNKYNSYTKPSFQQLAHSNAGLVFLLGIKHFRYKEPIKRFNRPNAEIKQLSAVCCAQAPSCEA